MEQELLRAHQRASKCHAPVSVCSVLLEQLLPKGIYDLHVAGELPTHDHGSVQVHESKPTRWVCMAMSCTYMYMYMYSTVYT